jgi:hypothetical protein
VLSADFGFYVALGLERTPGFLLKNIAGMTDGVALQ